MLTNQSASLYDEIRYGFEHARPPENRLSLLGVGRSITAQGRKAAGSDCGRSTPKLILGGWAEIVIGKCRVPSGALEPRRAADMVLIDWHQIGYPYLDAETPLLDAVLQRAKNQRRAHRDLRR